MKLFNSLALEIASACNRSCSFCPVATYKRLDESMDPRLLTKATKELQDLNYKGRVEFYIYNEPLKNRDLLNRALKTFSTYLPKATLMISTNGDYLKGAKDLENLFQRGLNQIVLNAYSPKQYPKFVQWLKEVGADTKKSVYKPAARDARIGQAMDKSIVENFGKGVHSLQNRAGSVPSMASPSSPLQKMCVKPFRFLNIDWKGRAILCCNDFYADIEIASFHEATLLEIWNHPVFVRYRRQLFIKDRRLPLCRTCDCHAGAYPHLVDDPKGKPARSTDIEESYQKKIAKRKRQKIGIIPSIPGRTHV